MFSGPKGAGKVAIAEAGTEERWAWTPEELEAMTMEDLLYNLARIVLRIGELSPSDDVRSLRGLSSQN